jgi:PPM family protein phosphatase
MSDNFHSDDAKGGSSGHSASNGGDAHPPGRIELQWGALSITGNYRENNEDKFFVDPASRYFLVADGMGGQSAGEKASELAIELIRQKLDQWLNANQRQPSEVVSQIDRAVSHANNEIMALGELEPAYKNMGTTITFIVVAEEELYIGGVGDSRVYLLREGELSQLTEDHSLTQALVKAGTISPAEAANHRYRNVLYRYLGTKDGGSGTEPTKIAPQAGDRYMLCSDGICDGLSDDEIRRILQDHDGAQETADKLVQAAQEGGSKDNITCVVIDVVA